MTDGTDRPQRLDDTLLVLARRHPRETWPDRLQLGGLGRFWLERHGLFRSFDRVILDNAEAALDDPELAAALRPWLARHLPAFLGGLDEHHRVEDDHYFPVFRRAEPRLASGFDLLDGDHAAIHAAIEGIAASAASVIGAGDGASYRAALGRFRDTHAALGRQLIRHLDDEEDLVIPLLIERGEDPLPGD